MPSTGHADFIEEIKDDKYYFQTTKEGKGTMFLDDVLLSLLKLD